MLQETMQKPPENEGFGTTEQLCFRCRSIYRLFL